MDQQRDKKLAALLCKAQQGDQKAYEEFLNEAAMILRRFLTKRMDLEMVEDVLQDTLLSVHRFLHTYLPDRPVGPWLYAICSNRLVDFYRRKSRIERIESATEIIPDMMIDTRHRAGVPEGGAIDALRKLPERQRRIIQMLKIYGLSVKEIAMQTGMSESSVKVTAFRGYQAIRKLMGTK